jgi:two-component system, NtrC family, sensor kinase
LSKDTDVTLARERDDAVEQLSATSEVLKLISSSPGDLQAVFAAILANAVRICEAKFGMLMLHRKSEGSFDARVMVGAPPALVDALLQKPFKPQPGVPLDRMMRTRSASYQSGCKLHYLPGGDALARSAAVRTSRAFHGLGMYSTPGGS